MKRLVIGLLVSVISVAGFSQTVSPQISFEKVVHDFGKIKEEGGTVTYKFEFVNTGGSPLIIQNVRATCGCTAPEWTRNPVAPGAKGFVAATFNPVGRPNSFSKYLYVDSNSEIANTRLTITGEVIPKPRTIEDDYRYTMGGLRLKSNHLAFGNIANSEKKDFELEIINTSANDLTLGVERVPAHLEIKFVPSVLKPNQKGVVKATYNAGSKNDWGMLIDRLNVTVNGASERDYRLTVSANVVEDFSALSSEQLANAPAVSVDNPEVDFGKMKQGDKYEHDFVLKNDGKSTLYIRKIEASCGCTAVKPERNQIEPGESVKIKAIFNAAGQRGNQNKNVTVITNDPQRSNLILRIKGEVIVS